VLAVDASITSGCRRASSPLCSPVRPLRRAPAQENGGGEADMQRAYFAAMQRWQAALHIEALAAPSRERRPGPPPRPPSAAAPADAPEREPERHQPVRPPG
jgi:hypothetical protein